MVAPVAPLASALPAVMAAPGARIAPAAAPEAAAAAAPAPRTTAPALQAQKADCLPPGQMLHVLENERPSQAESGHAPVVPALAVMPSAHQAEPSRVVAVPVRVQPDSRAEAAASSQSALLVPTEEGAFWHSTVQQLVAGDAVTALVRELALQSQLVARDTDQWILRVERESLNQPLTRERLAAALQAVGHPVQLAVEIGRVTDSPARRNAAATAEKLLAAERTIFEDPFVQQMMRDFGAKIVPGSIKPL